MAKGFTVKAKSPSAIKGKSENLSGILMLLKQECVVRLLYSVYQVEAYHMSF